MRMGFPLPEPALRSQRRRPSLAVLELLAESPMRTVVKPSAAFAVGHSHNHTVDSANRTHAFQSTVTRHAMHIGLHRGTLTLSGSQRKGSSKSTLR